MPTKRRKRTQRWSYQAGKRGRNAVNAYQDARDGRYWIEWRERVPGGRSRRVAVLLEGVTDPSTAESKADAFAVELGKLRRTPLEQPVTVALLMERYSQEVTPTKGAKESRAHDQRARRVWTAFFAAQPEPGRRTARHPSTLDRIDWDRFVAWRRRGRIPGWAPVRDRAVERDLKYLLAVLTWATGTPLLEANPWRTEVRRAQRWTFPRELSPRRPEMTDEVREGLIAYAPGWQFAAMLVLERETRRRNSAIRRLSWSDVDQARWTVRWRGELDKAGRERVTPLTAAAVEVLKGLASRAIGDVPVFPSAKDPQLPTPRNTCQIWLRRAKEAWLKATPEQDRPALQRALQRVGYHAEKRTGVRDPRFRGLAPKVQEELAGTSWEVLRDVYDAVAHEELAAAVRCLGEGPMGPETGTNGEHERRAEG